MRLAGGRERERHGAERTAARMTSTGAGTPVQSSNDAAPWRRAPRARRRRARPRRAQRRRSPTSGYGRSTSVWPARSSTSTSSRTGVAFTTRSASATSGGQSPLRENTRAACGSAAANARAAPPSPTIAALPDGRPVENRRVRRAADDAPVPEDERVHRRLVASRRARATASLCGDRDVRAGEAGGREPAHRLLEPLGRHVERDVRPVEPARREGRVLHPRRERVRDRVPEQRDQPRACPEWLHPPASRRSRARRGSAGTPSRPR